MTRCRRLILAATWSLLACRPAPERPDLEQAGDPAPPEAPVLATLTDYGVIEGDPRTGTETLPAGAVLSTSPKRHASISEPLVVEFSTAMRDQPAAVRFRLSPPADGKATWTSPRRLAFEPTHSLTPATAYSVHVEGTAETRDGQTVTVDHRWSFETPRPTADIQSDYASFEDDDRDRVVWNAGFRIQLSDNATAADVRAALRVTRDDDGRSRPLPYRLVGDFDIRDRKTTRYWKVLPRGHWPADATIRATLADTLRTRAGTLPTGREVFATLRTRAGVKAQINCDDSAKDGCVIGSFSLDFDASLPLSAAKAIRVSPRPKGFDPHVWNWRDEDTFSGITFYGEFEAGRTYTVKLGKSIRDVHGQSLVGGHTRKVTFVAPPPTLDLHGAGTQLSGHTGTIGVEARAVEDAKLVISTLSNAALAEVIATPKGERRRPEKGADPHTIDLDLKPGGTWGWDARGFDLSRQFGSPSGAAFIELSPGKVRRDQVGRADVEPSHGFVQLTNLGVLAGTSPSGGFVRVLALDTAKPVQGATAHLFDVSKSPAKRVRSVGPSDAQGFIAIPDGVAMHDRVLIVDTDDDRVALHMGHSGHGYWRSHNLPESGAEFDIGVVMTDRDLFQPGERMRVMGWTARTTADHEAGIEGSGTRPVVVTLTGADDEVLARSRVRTKAYGKFWATLDIPEGAKLGTATIEAVVDGDDEHTFSRYVSLREFVAPAFDVSLALDEVELQHGENTRAFAVARYLHGMPLPVASASTQLECRSTRYKPVDAGDYAVAYPTSPAYTRSTGWSPPLAEEPAHAKGRVTFEVDFATLSPGHPYACTVSLLTRDAARQEIATSTKAWVHPSRYLLVSHSDETVRVGKPHALRAKALRPDGSPTTTKAAKASIVRYAEGGDEDAGACTLRFSADGTAKCEWTPKHSGMHGLVVRGSIDGVTVEYEDRFYVQSARTTSEHKRFDVKLPTQAKVGSLFDVDVETSRPTGEGVGVEVHAGIRRKHPFSVSEHSGRYSLRAKDSWTPRAYVDTFVVYPDGAHRLPGIEMQFHDVRVGYGHRELTVEVTNPEVASVGSTLPIDIAVVGTEGNPVEDAHVSVWAVDEGILMLRDWRFPNFTRALTLDRGNEAQYFNGYDALRRPYVVRNDPFEPGSGGSGLGLGGGSAGGGGFGSGHGSIGSGSGRAQTRKNFDPAPIFIGDVKTGPDGTARVHGVLPDNLTTFRIAAVATAEVAGTGAFARAGRDESQVRVTQDLSVRPILPRVLRPGDAAQLGVLVDNLTDVPGTLEIEVELRDAKGKARITSPAAVRQRLDDGQVRIPVDVAALAPGELRVWVHATLKTDDGRTLKDASELPLEIRAERTLVRYAATYGSFSDQDAGAVALNVPAAHVPGSAKGSVDVYASMLGGYESAATDLVQYPYGCVEQTSSRLVPLAALRGLEGFDLGVDNVDAFIRAGVQRLDSMRTPEGGLAYWPGGYRPHVYATAYATWVLSELKRAGVTVNERLIEGAADFLTAELARTRSYATPTAHQDVRAAMALLALASVGRSEPEVMDDLLARQDTLPAFSRAVLAMALHATNANDPRLPDLLDSVRDRIDLRDKTAHAKAESQLYAAYFDSPIRTDAMVLLALVRTAPDDALIEPLARGLTQARNAGKLRNTQENAYALLAMAGYTQLREAVEPDMDVRAWIGADMVLDTAFEGRDLTVHQTTSTLVGLNPLVTLQRLGEGRLYYRVGMQWSPEPESVEAQARGIAIDRVLYDADGEVDGRAMVAGEPGTLEVSITTDTRHRYVALDVPLPAGIEAVDRSLGRGGASRMVGSTRGGPGLPYDHHELRGDRVLVFVDHLPAGTYRYRVPVRATHEGLYSMPPATAHAMYSPEIQGNTDGTQLRVVSASP